MSGGPRDEDRSLGVRRGMDISGGVLKCCRLFGTREMGKCTPGLGTLRSLSAEARFQ